MRISNCLSHLGGKEFIEVHQPRLWDEIEDSLGRGPEQLSEGDGVPRINSFRSMQRRLTEAGWKPASTSASAATALILTKQGISVRLPGGGSAVNPCNELDRCAAAFARGWIDVGVVVAPIACFIPTIERSETFEATMANLRARGRGQPRVPLVIVGVAT
ncbi:MAG: hypothetical protein ACP5NP_01190 [Acetobacteraceae bacterium]